MRGGKGVGAGRSGCTPNKITQDLRQVLHQFTAQALNDLPKMFKGLESDKERLDILIKLLPYVAPRLQAIAIQEEQQGPQEIIVRYVSAMDTPPMASDEAFIDFNKTK